MSKKNEEEKLQVVRQKLGSSVAYGDPSDDSSKIVGHMSTEVIQVKKQKIISHNKRCGNCIHFDQTLWFEYAKQQRPVTEMARNQHPVWKNIANWKEMGFCTYLSDNMTARSMTLVSMWNAGEKGTEEEIEGCLFWAGGARPIKLSPGNR